jgi:HAD superfamily hydrolase (TIGR01509 family)
MMAVVFDMDGTLFDSTECVTTAYRRAVAAAGGPGYSARDIVAAYPLGPPAAILGHLLGRPATTADEARYLTLLREHENLIFVYDGITNLLGELASRGLPLAVFTGASTAAATQLLASTRLLSFFSVVVGGDEVPRPKPEPDGILRACDRLGVAPSRTGYVGDSPLDVEAARRSGALAVGAAWGHLFDPEAPCDVVATRPQDLLSIVRATT